MKNFKFKNLFLGIFFIACFSIFAFYPNNTEIEKIKSYASFSIEEEERDESSQFPSNGFCTPEGHLPFSIYTSTPNTNSSYYNIVNYKCLFDETTTSENEKTVYNFSITNDSIPYIFLCSNDSQEYISYYNKTLYFKFNDINYKSSTTPLVIPTTKNDKDTEKSTVGGNKSTIPTVSSGSTQGTGYMAIYASLNGERFDADISTTPSTEDCCYIFAVNLKNDINTLSPNRDGLMLDVSSRTGFYEFTIEYSYKDNQTNEISNKCVFKTAFYVVDFYDYVKNSSPLTFENTNTFSYLTNNDYEIYNYNYTNAPYVNFDATKFALNFDLTVGDMVYNYIYDDFVPFTNAQNKSDGEQTGNVVITLKNEEKYYTIKTYKNGTILYYAKFDLKDFENFLQKNTSSKTFQGIYSFNLDFLISNSTSGYTVFDSALSPNTPEGISNKKLVIFGYDLKYYDQDKDSSTYHQNVSLKNNYSWNNFVAYNGAIGDNSTILNSEFGSLDGLLKNIPENIPLTNQAPLRFDYLGDLNDGVNYETHFTSLSLDYKGTIESNVLNLFNTSNNVSALQLNFPTNSTSSVDDIELLNIYNQGNPISSDGIKIFKLDYIVNIEIEGNLVPLRGCQYVVFEINNSIQNLYIQAIDYENEQVSSSYDFNTYTNKDVRINIEEKPYAFLVPVTVSYSYKDYNTNSSYTSGVLNYKLDNNSNKYSYKINGKSYNYFVDGSNKNLYTFTNSGTYKVVIKNILSNIPTTYYFTIDKTEFKGIQIKNVDTIKDNKVLGSDITASLITGNKYVKNDLAISNECFTLGWQEKASGAKSYSYVYYMETKTDTSLENNMYQKTLNSEYWITNGNIISSPSGAIDTFVNYKSVSNYTEKPLTSNSYFNKEGLYIFYVFDQAGNYFTRTVLIDNSLSHILQGYWDEENEWKSNYDLDKNPANYVKEDTIIYFGSHKALYLPELNLGNNVSFEDISFTKKYNLTTPNGDQAIKEKITIDLYNQILSVFTNYIQNFTDSPIIKNTDSNLVNKNYFLTLRNTQATYTRTYEEGEDKSGSPIEKVVSNNIDEIYFSKIYVSLATLDNDTEYYKTIANNYNFYGESEYFYVVTNLNGIKSSRDICMNFDTIQGTFWAYNKDTTNESHLIRKNKGTNLDILTFTYNKVTDKTADFYELKSLDYEYYPFVVDDSSSDNEDSYPFAENFSKSGSLLSSAKLDKNGTTYTINGINLNSYKITMAGKYVLTREYVGGTHNLINGIYVPTENNVGGKYYYDEDLGEYKDLFVYDTPTRKYVVYVDHNGIITESYMIREDEQENIREVGDNVSITLSYLYDDNWSFKEFFLTSSSVLALDTNKVPVLINIPLSKYFVYYSSYDDNLYSSLYFTQLNVKIVFYTDIKKETYVVDGFDSYTGFCTCSKLKSDKNPNGFLIFNSAGTYEITIFDQTGYVDTSSLQENSNNVNPTTFNYSFTISHNAPEATVYTNTYNSTKGKFEETKLNKDENSNTFATNIKKENVEYTVDDNKLFVNWSDPSTPYEAKINQINITIKDKQTNKTIIKNCSIDLQSTDENENYIYDLSSMPFIQTEFFDNNNEIFNFICSFDINYYNNISTPSIFDFQNYYRYSYRLYLDIEKEYEYTIELSYISNSHSQNQGYYDENGTSYASSTYSIIIDRTKPNTNIDNLLQTETYLAKYYNTNLSNFKEENFDINALENTPSTFTYAFAVLDNYKLTYNQKINDTLSYFYVRQYNKFVDDYCSITPDMVDTIFNLDKSYYTDYSKISKDYPRFTEMNIYSDRIISGDYTWYKIYYNNSSTLKELISSVTNDPNPKGFYEIIERDLAGNYRNFTVYYNEYNNIFQNLIIDGYTQKDNGIYLISTGNDAENDNINATVSITLEELTTKLGWGTITIKNETSQTEFGSIVLTPYDDYNPTILNYLTNINQFLTSTSNTKFSFKLSTYNANYNSTNLTRYINFSTSMEVDYLGKPTISSYVENEETYYSIILPVYNKTKIVYPIEMTLQKYNETSSQWINTEHVYTSKETIALHERIMGLTKGVYKIIYKDNFHNDSYSRTLHIGENYIESFDKKYKFENETYLQCDNIYYSGGSITVIYEANVYNLAVYYNGVLNTSFVEEIYDKANNYKTFTINPSNISKNSSIAKSIGSEDIIELVYTNTMDTEDITRVYFKINNIMPEIILTDSIYGQEINSSLTENSSEIINSTIKLNWGFLSFYDNIFNYTSHEDFVNSSTTNTERERIKLNDKITAFVYTLDEYGEYKNETVLNRDGKITEEGTYKVVLKNTLLNNTREIFFTISFQEAPLYKIRANNILLSPSKYEQLNLNNNTALYINNQTYLIDIVKNSINGLSSVIDKNSLLIQLNQTYNCNTTDVSHYYTNYKPSKTNKDFSIAYNKNVNLNIIEFTFKNGIFQYAEVVSDFDESGLSENNPILNLSSVGSDFWTVLTLVYDLSGPFEIEFYALTFVPKTNTLLTKNEIYYLNENSNTGTTYSINLNTNQTNYTLTNKEIKNSDINIQWNALSYSTNISWYNIGNVITLYDQYGVSNESDLLDCTLSNNTMNSILKGSGSHVLKFVDIAGNIHEFASKTSSPQKTYEILLLDSVIYHITYNDEVFNSINHGVFNDLLDINIDYFDYYNSLNIIVTRNGSSYYGYTVSEDNKTYSFSDSGRYVVTFSALYGKEKNALNNAVYNFTIISSTSARLAYEFVETTGFEILQVTRSGLDITDNFKDKEGKILSIFLSSTSASSGNGNYMIRLKYGQKTNEVLKYTFIINNYVPTLSCNVKHGETTTSSIVVSYNPNTIFEQLGECYIKVLTYNNDSKTFYNYGTISINSDSLTSNEAKSFEITRSNSYFIQVETKNGNVLSSFRVNKKDPLNTMAIIIIAISAIGATALTIVVIKLRTRMKIR